MEDKYYTLWYNKSFAKNEPYRFKVYEELRKKFSVFTSEYLYLKLRSGVIACQDADYGSVFYKMPLIIKKNENGYFDYITDTKIYLIEPIELYKELSLEEVYEMQKNLRTDNIGFLNYCEGIKELNKLLENFKNDFGVFVESCTISDEPKIQNNNGIQRTRINEN